MITQREKADIPARQTCSSPHVHEAHFKRPTEQKRAYVTLVQTREHMGAWHHQGFKMCRAVALLKRPRVLATSWSRGRRSSSQQQDERCSCLQARWASRARRVLWWWQHHHHASVSFSPICCSLFTTSELIRLTVEWRRLLTALVHFTLLRTMATPLLLHQLLFPTWQSQSVSSQALWAATEPLPYVALVSTAGFSTVGQTLLLMLFRPKRSASGAGLWEFWLSGCLSGCVPPRVRVRVRRQIYAFLLRCCICM